MDREKPISSSSMATTVIYSISIIFFLLFLKNINFLTFSQCKLDNASKTSPYLHEDETREETHVHHQALKPLANQCLKPGSVLARDLARALHLSRGRPKKRLQ